MPYAFFFLGPFFYPAAQNDQDTFEILRTRASPQGSRVGQLAGDLSLSRQ